MQVVHARATFVAPDTVDESLTTIVARSVLEAALQEEDSAELWFDLADETGEEVGRVSVDLAYSDIEELLRLSSEDEIALSLDGEAVENLFADVEAHGLNGALAIAVTGAALLAPATQAAVPQATQQSKPQATAQVSAAATAQVSAAATAQVSSVAAKTQVTLQNKAQVSKIQVAHVQKLKLLRSALIR
jgi:hypothetical protein